MHWLLEIWFWSAVGAAISCTFVTDLKVHPESRFAIYIIALCPVVNTIAALLGIVIGLTTLVQIVLEVFTN